MDGEKTWEGGNFPSLKNGGNFLRKWGGAVWIPYLLGGFWGKWLTPLLWIPFFLARGRKDILWGMGWVWVAYVIVFSSTFFAHPASTRSFWVAWLAASGVGIAAFIYMWMHVWPVVVFPLNGRPWLHRGGVWLSLALLTEWLTVKIRVLVPVFYLTDVAAVVPVNLLTRFWQPWASTWLAVMAVWSWADRRNVLPRWWRWMILGGIALAWWKLPEYASQRVERHWLLLVSPGIQHDTVFSVFLDRYRRVFQTFLKESLVGVWDTLWVILPEGSLGSEWHESFEQRARWLEFKRWVRKEAGIPVGWVWEGTVEVRFGRKRARLFWETPGGIRGHYDKRWLFVFGEKAVVSPFGISREPGPMEQAGFMEVGDVRVFFLLCNEGLTAELLRVEGKTPSMILVPAQMGWVETPWNLRETALRYRLVVESTGMPLCTVQRQGALYCYVPTPLGTLFVGDVDREGPGYLLVPLWVGKANPFQPYADAFLWSWIFLWLGVFVLFGKNAH